MNRRFALPAAIALTGYAVLVLGSQKPPIASTAPLKPVAEIREKLPDRLPDEVILIASREDCEGPAVQLLDHYRVSRDEYLGDGRSGITQAYVPGHRRIEIESNGSIDTGTWVPVVSNVKPQIEETVTAMMLDEPPRTRSQVPPRYPHGLKSAGITGEVMVEFVVDELGRVHDVRVVRSNHPEFNDPTTKAVGAWRFEPGRRHGLPVRFRMTVPIIFRIED